MPRHRSHLRVRLVTLSLVTLLTLLVSACQPTAAPTTAPAMTVPATSAPATSAPPTSAEASTTGCAPSGQIKRGGELVFARYEEPITFDPGVPGDNGSIWAIVQVMETLTRPDKTGAGIEPALAQSWDISADGLVYIFHLREAKFSNGDPVTAADAAYSLERARGPKSGYAFVYAPVATIEAVDAKTLKITLSAPYAPFLSAMSLFTGAVVPQKVHEADPDGFGTHPIGSGPFMVQEYTRGDKVVLVPNPNYWELGADCKPLPYLDKVTMLYVPESNSRVLGLRNADYDVISAVPYNEAAAFGSEAGKTLEVAPIYRLDYVYLNHAKPPLDKKEFRLALNYATNREAILKTVFFGYGELPNGYWPKMNSHSPDVEMIPYDPDKAKDLLSQAGYAGEKLELMIPAGDAPAKQTATILQQNWSQVGINVELVELDSGTAFENTVAGDYQAYVSYITSDINDDDELATLQGDYKAPGDFHSFFSWYQSDEVSELLAKARATADNAERAKYYAQAQQIAYWDGYSVPLNYTPAINAYASYVKNWANLTTGWWWLKDVWLDK
jgi:peptide/nickel transport system substrate-binding protein